MCVCVCVCVYNKMLDSQQTIIITLFRVFSAFVARLCWDRSHRTPLFRYKILFLALFTV